MINPFGALDRFLHDRTGRASGIRIAGRMRAAFAVLYLIDQLLLSTCLNEFMSPSSGIIPIRMGREVSLYDPKYQRSLLEFCYLPNLCDERHGSANSSAFGLCTTHTAKASAHEQLSLKACDQNQVIVKITSISR